MQIPSHHSFSKGFVMTVTEEIAELVNVSYSKAQAFRTCKFKYQQAHITQHPEGRKPGLMAKTKSKALARGTHGHAILR